MKRIRRYPSDISDFESRPGPDRTPVEMALLEALVLVVAGLILLTIVFGRFPESYLEGSAIAAVVAFVLLVLKQIT